MKKRIVFRIAAIIFGVFAIVLVGKGVMWYNWSHLTAEEKASKITERLASRLDLTIEQKEKVLALNLEKIKSFNEKDFWRSHHRKGDDRKTNPVYEEWRKEMKGILNDDQEKKMKW